MGVDAALCGVPRDEGLGQEADGGFAALELQVASVAELGFGDGLADARFACVGHVFEVEDDEGFSTGDLDHPVEAADGTGVEAAFAGPPGDARCGLGSLEAAGDGWARGERAGLGEDVIRRIDEKPAAFAIGEAQLGEDAH